MGNAVTAGVIGAILMWGAIDRIGCCVVADSGLAVGLLVAC